MSETALAKTDAEIMDEALALLKEARESLNEAVQRQDAIEARVNALFAALGATR